MSDRACPEWQFVGCRLGKVEWILGAAGVVYRPIIGEIGSRVREDRVVLL